MNRKRKAFIRYIGILILLLLPLFGLIGVVISRTSITPNDEFFVITKGEIPDINISNWTLTFDGHINNNLLFNYSDFTSQPSKEVLATIQCVEGPSGTALWKGVSVKYLLDLAELKTGAVDVVFYAADAYSSSLTIEEASADDVLLAYEMNSELLPVEQGFPVRVVAPNHQGYKWVKWVVRVEVVNYDYEGYWESQGWNDDASITPFSDWIWHAMLLSISLVFGGVAIISGLKRSPITKFFRDLPKFVNKKFHIAVGISYFLTSLGVFLYWIISTITNRGAIFYTIHGITALISIILVIPGVITGFKKSKKRDKYEKTLHYRFNLYSFYLFLATILLGFSLVFFNIFRLDLLF
ncbi:MAG: molybdopterin-dependent oxidoreductase [Promethearchaeota archaeon]